MHSFGFSCGLRLISLAWIIQQLSIILKSKCCSFQAVLQLNVDYVYVENENTHQKSKRLESKMYTANIQEEKQNFSFYFCGVDQTQWVKSRHTHRPTTATMELKSRSRRWQKRNEEKNANLLCPFKITHNSRFYSTKSW